MLVRITILIVLIFTFYEVNEIRCLLNEIISGEESVQTHKCIL